MKAQVRDLSSPELKWWEGRCKRALLLFPSEFGPALSGSQGKKENIMNYNNERNSSEYGRQHANFSRKLIPSPHERWDITALGTQ